MLDQVQVIRVPRSAPMPAAIVLQFRWVAERVGSAYRAWAAKFPIVSIDDGLAESDWIGFKEMTAAMGATMQIVGSRIDPAKPKIALSPTLPWP